MNKKDERQYVCAVESVKAYFEENLSGNIKFSDIITVAGIGENNLKKYFKVCTGESIMKYFKIRKINRAKKLIETGKYNFTEISVFLGYESIHCFSRQFKAIEGVTPTEYRNNNAAVIFKKEDSGKKFNKI